MANRWGNRGNSGWLFLRGLQNHFRWWLQPWNEKTLIPWKKNYDKPRQCIKKQRQHFANKSPDSLSYGFSSSHVWMWKLDHKDNWAPNKCCFSIVMLEKTLESSLDCKEIKPVHPKENQPWIFKRRMDAETEAPTLWPHNAKSWLIGKDLAAGKDWSQEEKGEAEKEMAR